MKKLALAVSAVAAFTGQALAADMPVKAVRPAPVVAAVSWTGCYVGGGGGYGMYYQENTRYDDGAPLRRFSTPTPNTDTFNTRGQGCVRTPPGGCRHQLNTGP